MNKNYNSYSLLKCCDIESNNKKQPEAIFVNKENQNEKIAIEVKKLFEVYDINLEKDNKQRKAYNHLNKNILDKIAEESSKIFNIIIKLFKINSDVISLLF